MLFVLTGDVQIGKTRWLERLVRNLQGAGITPYGVIAPGVWADRRNAAENHPQADDNGFEKLGIDNVLLPQGERIAFARRADLAERDEAFDPNSQSARAKLRWHISDAAIERVNAHFAGIAPDLENQETPGILIVDELGQLELVRKEGLTQAVALLEKGPFPAAVHALIVVREALLPHLDGRFDQWGQQVPISPDETSRERVLDALSARR